MAWTAPRNWIAGETVTAALLNAHIRDNEAELRAGGLALASQAAGDVLYGTSASQLGRVAGAATGAALISGGTGSAPAWSRVPPLDGVKFPFSPVDAADGNTLDDYEEGSWTPVVGGSGGTSGQTYAANGQTGRYIKIGRLLVAIFEITFTAKGTITGNVELQGLPFSAENVTNLDSPSVVRFAALGTSWIHVLVNVRANEAVGNFIGNTAAAVANTTNLATADISNTTSFKGVVIYRAA